MKKWYDAGYVYKDVTTTKEMAEDLVKSNVAFYGIEGTHYQVKDGVGYYIDGQDSTNCGYHTIL